MNRVPRALALENYRVPSDDVSLDRLLVNPCCRSARHLPCLAFAVVVAAATRLLERDGLTRRRCTMRTAVCLAFVHLADAALVRAFGFALFSAHAAAPVHLD